MSAVGWRLVYGGRTPPPGSVVRPGERLSSLRMAGLGAQHVVAMFGATFIFPALMGLSPNLAVLMSGVATILFLLIVNGKVPSYLGTSAAFVAAAAARPRQRRTMIASGYRWAYTENNGWPRSDVSISMPRPGPVGAEPRPLADRGRYPAT